MNDMSQALLRTIMATDASLEPHERTALAEFIETKTFQTTTVAAPLLLNVKNSAALVGISVDTFKLVREQAEREGIRPLQGNEITPGQIMFARTALVAFSQGEFSLNWPGLKGRSIVTFEPVSNGEGCMR